MMKRFTSSKWLILCALACFMARLAHAQPPASGDTNLLMTWTFWDTNNWHSDWDYAPKNFTNLSSSALGDGAALVLNSTNFACLRYNVTESSGTNNIQFNAGTVLMWISPAWASADQGGAGPGQWGRLVEAGTYTSDASYGWFSVYLDPGGTNIYFSVQTNNGNGATYLSAPISWASNVWHHVALSYCSTNSALYIDGNLATNGAGVAYWPGPDVLTNGFCIGSDSTGTAQARGTFDDIATYNIPLDATTIEDAYFQGFIWYRVSPWDQITSAPFTNTVTPTYYAVTGQGLLTTLSNSVTCVTNSDIWITNVTAKTTSNVTTIVFTIQGGANGVAYDVFANSVLAQSSDTNRPWSWMGQGYHCVTYSLAISNATAFLILGQPTDSDADGLTDAYELLVSKTRPDRWDTDGDGMSDGWEVQFGTNPLVDETALPASRLNFIFDSAGRLKASTGPGQRSETIGFDREGNIQQDSQ
jgi:hypothetical protein